ncbi:hypothetical protein [Salinimicrobium sp. TH3]|uniref:hypothetical protein n=1 Tax=Salinimicrobium sp. TH3 TaxID=2997342 RepID=UPI00227CD149|nr:hypothetical protein [Salinimicrobium sp. TH3]
MSVPLVLQTINHRTSPNFPEGGSLKIIVKMLKKVIFLFGFTLITACEERVERKSAEGHETAISHGNTPTEQGNNKVLKSANTGAKYKLWDQVPNNEVCMVNNAYMGRLQLEVPYDGRMYYGCCEMCVERIPQDEDVRIAIDPMTSEEVDKATAFIVLTGEQREVAYFKNEENYLNFLKIKEKSLD